MALSQQWLDELRSRLTLSTIIGRHVKVQRAGREFKACCPFHNEKSPSFTINDEKGFYHCFGCGAHGDAIRFMTDNRGLAFMDAIKELAAEAGLSVPAPDPQAARQAEQRATLHDVCAAAAGWFQAQLKSDAGAEARSYLARRGLSQATISRFGLGFAPDSRDSLKAGLSDLGEELLIEAGLLIKVDDKPSYDRFRGRIMIPIRDPRGRPIAFGGRILGDGEPKYLNSPETPLFDKGRTLYNLDVASPASRQKGRVIVVEGYMDVIALAQAGFDEAVAPLGTALTEHQIERLWKMVDYPVLCFDGDNAGQKAAMRAASRALPLLRPGQSLGFATLPVGKDPDDLVRSEGPHALAALLEHPQTLLDRLWQHEWVQSPLDTPENRAGFKKRLMDHVENIGDADIKALYGREFRQRFSDTFFAPKAQTFTGFQQSPDNRRARQGKAASFFELPPSAELKALSKQQASDFIVRAVLTGLLLYPEAINRHSECLAQFAPFAGAWSGLMGAMIDASEHTEKLDNRSLVAILDQRGHRGTLKRLQETGIYPFSFCQRDALKQNDGVDDPRADQDLAEAISVMTIRPRLEAALLEVTQRFEASFGEDVFLEQQRLRAQKDQFDQRLIALVSQETAA